MPNYDVDYFLDKFSAIPEDQWCIGQYTLGQRHCALGHCGFRTDEPEDSEEGRALNQTFRDGIAARFGIVPDINDGRFPLFQQPTPKARILAALHAIKAKLCPSSS